VQKHAPPRLCANCTYRRTLGARLGPYETIFMMKTKKILFVLLLASLYSCSSPQKESYVLSEYKANRISIKIKDNPKTFYINETYWLSIDIDSIQKKDLVVYMTNGRITKSKTGDYDFMFIPEQIGKFKITIGSTSYLGDEKYGDIEINATEKKE
jgi:hypothetical protein